MVYLSCVRGIGRKDGQGQGAVLFPRLEGRGDPNGQMERGFDDVVEGRLGGREGD